MAASRPTILFVPGAWLSLSNYTAYISALQYAGYSTITTTYPSLNPSDPETADCSNDAAAIRLVLSEILSEGKEVVIIGHSYASMPASAAAKGQSVSERKAGGHSGGVIGLIFIAAFLVPEGISCAGAQGGNLPGWILLNTPSKGLNVAENPIQMFSDDQSSEYSDAMLSSLRPHSNLAFLSAQPPAAHLDPVFRGRLGYQVTTTDRAVPCAAQRGMMAGTGVPWIVHEIVGSHMAPFMSHISESVQAVDHMIEQFSHAPDPGV